MNLVNKIESCRACPLTKKCGDLLPLPGKVGPKTLLLFSSPNYDEALLREPLQGREGSFLKCCFEELNIGKADYGVSYLIKCSVRESDIQSRHVSVCKGWLWQEFKTAAPSIVVTFGKWPFVTLTKSKKSVVMSDIVSSDAVYQLDYLNAKLYPCYSLSYVLNNGVNCVREFKHILARAFRKLCDDERRDTESC